MQVTTRHVPWAPNTQKMCLRPNPGRKRILNVFRAQGTHMSGG